MSFPGTTSHLEASGFSIRQPKASLTTHSQAVWRSIAPNPTSVINRLPHPSSPTNHLAPSLHRRLITLPRHHPHPRSTLIRLSRLQNGKVANPFSVPRLIPSPVSGMLEAAFGISAPGAPATFANARAARCMYARTASMHTRPANVRIARSITCVPIA
jgi:hypothetical protein